MRKRAPRRRQSTGRIIDVSVSERAHATDKVAATVQSAAGAAAGRGAEGADVVAGKGGVHSDDLLPLVTGRRSL